jgi:hypothetical protein
MAKGFKSGGRRKGTPNKSKRPRFRNEVLDRAMTRIKAQVPEVVREMTPLEAILLVMRWSLAEQDRPMILAAASAAAPYCHARLQSAEVRVINPASGMSDEELKAEIEALERRIKAPVDPEKLN